LGSEGQLTEMYINNWWFHQNHWCVRSACQFIVHNNCNTHDVCRHLALQNLRNQHP